MERRLKISIISPVYNVADYITDCLQSVMRQTYQGAIECILVDDCGTDDSIAIAEQLIADYKGVVSFRILHHDRNRGLSAARNTGTAAASGEYIFYLDSDDYLSDDCIEVLTKPLQEKEYDMVVGDYETFGGECLLFLSAKEGENVGNTLRNSMLWKEIYVMAWNKLISTQFIKEFGILFKEGIIHEDELWHWYLSCLIRSCFVIKQTTLFYRIRGNGIIGNIQTNSIQAAISMRKIVIEIVDTPWANVEAYHPAINSYILYLYQKAISYSLKNDYKEIKSFYYIIHHKWKYNPIKLFISGKINLREVKRHLYFGLPSWLGWIYLQIKFLRNRYLN